jgi:6-phosphogluconolactonase (cycloisomerase 2 family)
MSIAAAGWRAARGGAVAMMLMTLAVGCGGGGGGDDEHTFDLPPGTAFDSAASERVLLVVESKNQCRDNGTCAATPAPGATPTPAGCDLGDGNTRGLSLYRLGTTGLFLQDPANPGAAAPPEQTIATADNPRRLVVHPNDPSLVYVATDTRIQVFRLGPSGASQCIAQTLTEFEADPNARDDLDPVDLAFDPTFGNGILYVAGRGSNRIDAYPVAADGTIGVVPASCVIADSNSEFTALDVITTDFVAASGRTRIDIYRREAGLFPPPTPAPFATPTPGPSPGCFGVQLITEPASSIGGAIVTDTFFSPSASAPLGQLFVAEEVSRRIFTFSVDATGTIDGNDTSDTDSEGFYQTMLRRDSTPSSPLYATVFQEGRVAAFQLQNGLLPNSAINQTARDPKTLPNRLAIDTTNQLLYVTQSGAGRVDAFRIQSNGGLDSLPVTSTEQVTVNGRVLDSFPSDVAIIPAP